MRVPEPFKGIDRRKNDEDIAERVIGGVRTDRSELHREVPGEQDASDDQPPRSSPDDHPRQR